MLGLHPCMEHGCSTMTKQPRCAQHTTADEARDRARRGDATDRGYDHAWRAMREAYARAHPLCEACNAKGLRIGMEIVDHRVALRDGGARLDPTNLQALCRSCHGTKTHHETRARGVANCETRKLQKSFRPPPINTALADDFSAYGIRRFFA